MAENQQDKALQAFRSEIDKIDGDIARSQSKLSNGSFTERAPKNVVDTERARLDGFESTAKKLRQQLRQLEVN